MKSNAMKLLVALAAGSALLSAVPAYADRDDHREWRDDHRGHGRHVHKHKHRHWDGPRERVVIRERIVERAPVVREYRYYERPRYYESPTYYVPSPPPPPMPVYSRDPALVIGVSVPPIVIPFR